MSKESWNWEAMLARPGQEMWRYPLEEIIPFVRELKARGLSRVYDLGCGAGRHTVFLAAQGFQVWAGDSSPQALQETRQWLAEAGLRAEDVVRADMAEQSFPADFFDAVVSVHTLYHQKEEDLRRTLAHIRTMLRPGGLLFCTFASARSSRFQAGRHERVEERTLIKPNFAGHPVLTHYVGREHLDDYFVGAGLSLLRVIHKEEEEREQDFWRHSHYIVWAERPQEG